VTGPPDAHDPEAGAYAVELEGLADSLGVRAAVHLLSREGGRVGDRTVADLYRVADALLLPSRDEGFGLPLLEAAACRLPVFLADLPPLREIAGDDAVYLDPAAEPAPLTTVSWAAS
jgi:glycosyltransferase involved in cell wall biosynthesis